jgi:tRNA(adenine34) deaminase
MDQATTEQWMRLALSEARKGEAEGEVPVGALLLLNEKIVGRGYNRSIKFNDPTAHAEILALRQAAHGVMNYRLPGSILVVTVEPCIMCVGAMIHARVEQVIYGAPDPKGGAVRSCFHLADNPLLNHTIRVVSGLLEAECSEILKNFFSARRE